MTKPELAIITNAFKNLKTKLPGNILKLTCDTREDVVTLGNWKGIPSKNTYTQQPLPISSLSINKIVMQHHLQIREIPKTTGDIHNLWRKKKYPSLLFLPPILKQQNTSNPLIWGWNNKKKIQEPKKTQIISLGGNKTN